ncbi:hypothetical protein EJB05_03078, partial [Eragrostis curvula]
METGPGWGALSSLSSPAAAAVMADLPSLDYSPGLGQQAEIWRRFRFPVVFSPNCGLGDFFLVLSVGRCKFRLTTFLVALILQAVLGGSAQSFKVEELRDRVYKFSVSCKKVGFYIYNLKSFECEAFKVLFHLWGNGGPQSLQEEQRWEQEQSNEWTEVLGKKKKKTYAEVTRSRNQEQSRGSKILSGANAVPIKQPLQKSGNASQSVPVTSVFNRIHKSLDTLPKKSVFSRLQFPQKSVFDRIEFPDRFSDDQREGIQISNPAPLRKDNGLNSQAQSTLGPNVNRPKDQRQPARFRSPRVGNVNTKPRVNLRYIPKKTLTPGASGGPRDQDINNEGNRAISFPGNPDSSPSLDLRLGTKNPETSSPPSPIQSTSQRASPEATPTPEESPMAYNHIDPAPFIPRIYERIEVPGRDTMVRAICGRAAPRNEDVAIARIHPMPHHQVPFIHIRDVLHDFFTQHIRIPVRSIQPCPFGQAYVRFESIQDRDMLADTGLHPFGDIDISFCRHNDGNNRRSVYFNRECWLLLLGFPLDYWSREHIEAAIRPFAKLEIWEKDLGNLARILIRVKVATLESVPRWVVITEGHDFRSNSWTVQCEILTQRMLGNEPGDEDPVPPPEQVGDDQPFDFFGFGQQAFGHAVAPVNQELFDNGPQVNNW